jgi:hypothetical protein
MPPPGAAVVPSITSSLSGGFIPRQRLPRHTQLPRAHGRWEGMTRHRARPRVRCYSSSMGPRAKPSPQPAPVVLDPADPRWADVVAGLDEVEAGKARTLTEAEAEHYYATGELPEALRTP